MTPRLREVGPIRRKTAVNLPQTQTYTGLSLKKIKNSFVTSLSAVMTNVDAGFYSKKSKMTKLANSSNALYNLFCRF